MYQVYIDSTLVYDDKIPDNDYLKLVDPTLDMDISSAGSFTTKVPPTNSGYSIATPLTSTVEIYRDGSWLWTGRPLTVDEDFFGMKSINCEGALSFLNDIIIPFKMYENKQVLYIVGDILDIYNSKVTSNSRKIYRGTISSSTEGGSPIANYSMVSDNITAMECINNIIEYWGLYPRIRKNGDKLYLDLITSATFPMSTQRIDFGRNLLDYTKENNWSDIVTSILPLGKTLDTYEESGVEEYPDRVNISSVNGGSKYLTRNSDKNKYGLIEQKVEWSDVDDPATLKQLAQVYLNELQFGDLTITITVADLHYLDSSIQAFALYTQVNCYSAPHNLDKTFVVTKMSIPFDHPENTKFTFSRLTYGTLGGNSTYKSTGKSMSNIAGHIPKITEFRQIARSNASNLILQATNGFVSLVKSEDGTHTEYMAISNTENLDDATSRWIWNVNGLMHQRRASKDDPWDPAETNLAMTMEGEIVADMITTGVIRAGENFINLDTGEVHLAYASYTDPTTGETKDFVELAQDGKEIAEAADQLAKENAQKVAAATAKAQKAYDKQVGSANLLYNTDTMASWVTLDKLGGNYDPWVLHEGVNDKTRGYNYYEFLGYSGFPITWTCKLKSPKGKLRVYDVKERRLTLSFYTRCGNTGGMPPVTDTDAVFITLALCDENGNRKLWRDIRVNERIPFDADNRVKVSFTMDKKYFNQGTYSGVIDGLYFEVWVHPRTNSHLYFSRFQLEFGDVATDWKSKSIDLQEQSEKLANAAYEASRVYTNAISEKDREFTKEQKDALNASFTQREVLKRLTNNFRTKGIYMQNNELYINGTYIRSGTIDAGIVKAGILTDTKQNNLWNMATGYFKTKNAVMQNANVTGQFTSGDWSKLMLKDGQIVGYQNNKRVGYIDATANVYDLDNGKTYKGVQIAGGILRISTSRIAVSNKDNVGKTSTTTYTGTIEWDVTYGLHEIGGGGLSWWDTTHGLQIINGLVVAAW